MESHAFMTDTLVEENIHWGSVKARDDHRQEVIQIVQLHRHSNEAGELHDA